MKNTKENNARVEAYSHDYKGRSYTGLRMSLTLDNGDVVECLIKPICKSNKTLAKLLYKISKGVK